MHVRIFPSSSSSTSTAAVKSLQNQICARSFFHFQHEATASDRSYVQQYYVYILTCIHTCQSYVRTYFAKNRIAGFLLLALVVWLWIDQLRGMNERRELRSSSIVVQLQRVCEEEMGGRKATGIFKSNFSRPFLQYQQKSRNHSRQSSSRTCRNIGRSGVKICGQNQGVIFFCPYKGRLLQEGGKMGPTLVSREWKSLMNLYG